MLGDCLPGERTSSLMFHRRWRQPCYQWCRSALSRHSGKPQGPHRASTARAPPSSPSPQETCSRSERSQRKRRPPAGTDMSTPLSARNNNVKSLATGRRLYSTASGAGCRAHRFQGGAGHSGAGRVGAGRGRPGQARAGRGGTGWGGVAQCIQLVVAHSKRSLHTSQSILPLPSPAPWWGGEGLFIAVVQLERNWSHRG